MGNKLKTVVFLGLLSGLFLAIGYGVGREAGMTIALLFAGVMNFVAWFFSDRIVLRLYGAREVPREAAPELHRIVDEVAARAQIPKPRVALIEGGAPNAFATGRSPAHAVVAVTSSLVQLLDREELKGVIAHEIGHIKHRDTLVMAVAATLGAAITHLAHMLQWAAIFGGGSHSDDDDGMGILGYLAMIILAPIAAVLIQAAVSRSREFDADAIGARIAGDGYGLASALEKLERSRQVMHMGPINPATAHLFIVNPLSGGGLLGLFATHPATAERIARLRKLAY
ncbi:MAG: zinc metalloprotease HtpX [Deltaproteobacteria bacterium]|nr:zinc metalloprotease HtpX [Deltaproteobacteria bacterium]